MKIFCRLGHRLGGLQVAFDCVPIIQFASTHVDDVRAPYRAGSMTRSLQV